MASALARATGPSLPEIIRELEAARDLPASALGAAVPYAAELVPMVIDLCERAARGVHLTPKQANLLFWSIHVLAAGRRTELYRPLLRIFAEQNYRYLDGLFGDGVNDTLASIAISVFDGDCDPLIDVCANPKADGAPRWSLMAALARLTFDGAVARERTLEFLERFERESLASPGDSAWVGWAEAIVLLALDGMRDRVHATWEDGRNPERKPDQRVWDERLTLACALPPGDPGLFVQDRIAALDDPVAALDWTAARAEDRTSSSKNADDPGAIFALTADEMHWLGRFCFSRHVPRGSMYLEMIDGLFSGHIAGPGATAFSEVFDTIWRQEGVPATPDYDSPEQADYVRALLARHWQTITMRLKAGFPHGLVLDDLGKIPTATGWAAGFLDVLDRKFEAWQTDEAVNETQHFIQVLLYLSGDEWVVRGKLTDRQRTELVATLPHELLAMHDYWHGPKVTRAARPSPRPDHKVGRNEPCPCGSGKKYKRCCGARE